MHIFFTIISNLNRCGFQRNRTKYATVALASIHSMLISHSDLRPIDVVIITILTAVVNYTLWTNACFDITVRVLFFTSFLLLKRWYVLVLIITISGSRLIEFDANTCNFWSNTNSGGTCHMINQCMPNTYQHVDEPINKCNTYVHNTNTSLYHKSKSKSNLFITTDS